MKSNKLINIGGALVMVPDPRAKILGLAVVAIGVGFKIYDEVKKRRGS